MARAAALDSAAVDGQPQAVVKRHPERTPEFVIRHQEIQPPFQYFFMNLL